MNKLTTSSAFDSENIFNMVIMVKFKIHLTQYARHCFFYTWIPLKLPVMDSSESLFSSISQKQHPQKGRGQATLWHLLNTCHFLAHLSQLCQCGCSGWPVKRTLSLCRVGYGWGTCPLGSYLPSPADAGRHFWPHPLCPLLLLPFVQKNWRTEMVPELINGRAFDARKPRAFRRMRAKLRSRVLATTNTVVGWL